MIKVLNEILHLLVTTDRDLEPWVCDTIVDAVKTNLCSPCFDWQSLKSFFGSSVQNIQLQLNIIKLLIERDVYSDELVEILPSIFNHIKKLPIDVLSICCAIKAGTQFSSVVESHKTVIMDTIKSCSLSSNICLKKKAVSFMAEYCFSISSSSAEDLNMLDDQNFTLEVLSYIYGNVNKDTAIDLFCQCNLPTSLLDVEVDSLCTLRAHFVCLKISRGQALADMDINYSGCDKYWKSFFVEIFSQLILKENESYSELFEVICAHDNIEILAALFKVLINNKDCFDTGISKLVLDQFANRPLLQKTLDFIYDDCSNLLQQRSAHSLLIDCTDAGLVNSIINVSNVCHHYIKCDITDYSCFISSFFTFISQCSPDTLALASPTLCKLVNLKEFKSSGISQHSKLKTILISKLVHGEPRVLDIILELINLLNPDLIESQIIGAIMDLLFVTEDFYIKSSCLSVLSRMEYKRLSQDFFREKHRLTLLNSLIESIEFDDSMVAISFFKFLQVHYDLIVDIINENISSIPKSSKTDAPLMSEDNLHNPNSLNVDDVIDDVCNYSDCSDVPLITKYCDKNKPPDQDDLSLDKHFVIGIFRLLVSHKCDIERLKASIDLMSLILRKIDSVDSRTTFLEFLELNYFPVVENFNSPFLRESISELNLVLGGYRVFNELTPSQSQNIETVLSLLKSTPDPSIVMDCY